MKNSKKYLTLFLLTFLAIGGCDIDFGGNADDDGGNGGGGSNDEIIQGTVVEVIPFRENNLSGITAIIMEEDGFLEFSDTTSSSGFFNVEGNFDSSNSLLRFLDSDNNDELLGQISINVFPEAEIIIGNIVIENGSIDPDDLNFTVRVRADLIVINCVDNTGSLTVESMGSNPIDIIVQVTNSTNITGNIEDFNCNDLLIGQTLDINGALLGFGNNVEASTINVE